MKNKNKKTEKFFNKLNAGIITGCIIIISGGMIFLERPTISETENRTLATMPEWSLESYFDGTFTDGVSEFYNDTVPLRSTFKKMNTKLTACLGIEADGVTFHGNVAMVNKNTDDEPAVTTAAQPAETEVSETEITVVTEETTIETSGETTDNPDYDEYWEEDENDIDNGKVSNGIIIYKNRGLMLYGSYESTLDSYVEAVNAYKQDLGESVNVYSMIIPTAAAYYLPEKYSGYSEDQFADLQYIRERLNGVIDVDVTATLDNHKKENIYLRTDHHWAPLGAYYATQKFAEIAGLDFPELSTYEEVSEEGYIGTIYTFTQDASILDYPETFTYYKPDNEYHTRYYDSYFQNGYDSTLFIDMPLSSLYVTFMGGDDKITHINTDAKNGRNVCVIKDSYGNATIPFLTHSFENIYVIDIRYFNINAINFMKENNVTDVLFAVNAFTSATPSMVRHIDEIRTQ
jgi:hypothetical protein